jgi:hypothetical protein
MLAGGRLLVDGSGKKTDSNRSDQVRGFELGGTSVVQLNGTLAELGLSSKVSHPKSIM